MLYILSWKCASRHNGVHFFDIATSKSGPTMVCLLHFDLEMCFAPQRRTLSPHLNMKNGPDPSVFYTFDLEICFAPQLRALFSTTQLPKVVRTCQFFTLLTWKCAARHNGVHFFDSSTSKSALTLKFFFHILTSKCASRHIGVHFCISHLARWLRTRPL